jgi:hypothetical protein
MPNMTKVAVRIVFLRGAALPMGYVLIADVKVTRYTAIISVPLRISPYWAALL